MTRDVLMAPESEQAPVTIEATPKNQSESSNSQPKPNHHNGKRYIYRFFCLLLDAP